MEGGAGEATCATAVTHTIRAGQTARSAEGATRTTRSQQLPREPLPPVAGQHRQIRKVGAEVGVGMGEEEGGDRKLARQLAIDGAEADLDAADEQPCSPFLRRGGSSSSEEARRPEESQSKPQEAPTKPLDRHGRIYSLTCNARRSDDSMERATVGRWSRSASRHCSPRDAVRQRSCSATVAPATIPVFASVAETSSAAASRSVRLKVV